MLPTPTGRRTGCSVRFHRRLLELTMLPRHFEPIREHHAFGPPKARAPSSYRWFPSCAISLRTDILSRGMITSDLSFLMIHWRLQNVFFFAKEHETTGSHIIVRKSHPKDWLCSVYHLPIESSEEIFLVNLVFWVNARSFTRTYQSFPQISFFILQFSWH